MSTDHRLSELLGSFSSFREEFRGMERRMEIQQKEAAEKRDQLYKRVEESTRNLILLTVKIEELEDRVHKAEDVTRRVVQWEQRGIGMLAMIGIAGTSIGAALAYVLHNLIGGLRLG